MSWKKKVYNKLTWPGFPNFGFSQYKDWTVRTWLLFSFGKFDSFLTGLGRN